MDPKPYSQELIDAIASWQNGWREDSIKKSKLANQLTEQAQTLPDAAKVVTDRCYRVLLLDKSTISALFFDGHLTESVSSWTTNRSLAAHFKSHLENDQVGVVFSHAPAPEEVVVNIASMWQDPFFVECLNSYRQGGVTFHEALYHFGPEQNNQSEVVLNVEKLKLSEISGFSGRSSFEGICALAGMTSEDERDEIWNLCLESDHQPDADVFWLTEEGTWRVIDRLTDRLEKLLTDLTNSDGGF